MGLNWLNPIALWGLLALVIPVFIHFWSKNKTKQIAFGSIRFLKESSTLQSKKIQLSEIFLLLLRLLIITLLVFMIAQWVSYQEVEKKRGILVGEDVNIPAGYSTEKDLVFKTSQFGDLYNHWDLLGELSKRYPEIDSLLYINDFKDSDFVGAIPELKYHLELIARNNTSLAREVRSRDTLLIHFDDADIYVKEKFNKVFKTTELYLEGQLKIKQSNNTQAKLLIGTTLQNQESNQIVLSDTISSDYLIYKKPFYSILYLREDLVQNPLREDVFLSVVTEFIAQLIEPNFQYSSFEKVYPRQSQIEEEMKKARTYNKELIWIIVLLMLLERYSSYRKKHV